MQPIRSRLLVILAVVSLLGSTTCGVLLSHELASSALAPTAVR